MDDDEKLYIQENYEVLSRCIKEDLGFKGDKPLAACIIYKCLLKWHAFESERTVIFDYIIEGINDALKVILLFQSLTFLFTILCQQCFSWIKVLELTPVFFFSFPSYVYL